MTQAAETEYSPYVAARTLRWGDTYLEEGQRVPQEPGRDYALMLRHGEIREARVGEGDEGELRAKLTDLDRKYQILLTARQGNIRERDAAREAHKRAIGERDAALGRLAVAERERDEARTELQRLKTVKAQPRPLAEPHEQNVKAGGQAQPEGEILSAPVTPQPEAAAPTSTPLPEKFPGRPALIRAGIGTLEGVRALSRDALIALPGVAETTADAILKAQEG